MEQNYVAVMSSLVLRFAEDFGKLEKYSKTGKNDGRLQKMSFSKRP